MSDLVFKCPSCGQDIEAPDDMAGEVVNCPSCDHILRVPSTTPPAEDVLVNFDCPSCGGNIEAPVDAAGHTVPCPHCTKEIVIPEPPQEIPETPVNPAALPPPGHGIDETRLEEDDAEERKKGSTSRIELPPSDAMPRMQQRHMVVKRSGAQDDTVPAGFHPGTKKRGPLGGHAH